MWYPMLGLKAQAQEVVHSCKERRDLLVYTSFNELDKTSPRSLSCTEVSVQATQTLGGERHTCN